jgi:ferrous iron transport protein B
LSNSTVTIAIAGNPNSGKSSLVNAIAGTRLQVGNWPGVTVEKKEATVTYDGQALNLVDLPGTYSLSPYTQEEIIARDYLLTENPDVILQVIDTTNIERNLFLTMQLMELQIPIVLALNMSDEAKSKGILVDDQGIYEILGIQSVATVATQRSGIPKLLRKLLEVSKAPTKHMPKKLNYGQDLSLAETLITHLIREKQPDLLNKFPKRWLAFKIIENDPELEALGIKLKPNAPEIDKILSHLRSAHNEDLEAYLSESRYGQAAGVVKSTCTMPSSGKADLTEKVDRLILHRIWGLPIFFVVMWLAFKMTFDLSIPLVDWVDGAFSGPVSKWATLFFTSLQFPSWFISLAIDGVIGGVGFVLVFVPVIMAMMFFITFLEGSGYMARAAFVMDRVMQTMGLHGKSFIPLLLGFGCNVPSIYATRSLESQRDRILTALIVPLMSCGARLPVYVLFVSAFFPGNAGLVLFSLYTIGIVLAIGVGIVFKKTLFRGEASMFLIELPPYRIPTLRNLLVHTWEKGKHFLIKAGTYILAVSVFVWFLLHMPWGVQDQKDSYLGKTGQVIAPLLAPIGFGTWQASSALLTGVIAKEIIVGTMGEIYSIELADVPMTDTSLSEDLSELGTSFLVACKQGVLNLVSTLTIASFDASEDESASTLKSVIKKQFTPLQAFSFMVFVLLYMPCIVTGIAMKQEFGTWKWFWVSTAYGLSLAWVCSFLIYQIGSRFW